MSLAIYAAPFDNDSNNDDHMNNNHNPGRKKVTHNRTQKNITKEPIQSEKVSAVLQTIQNTIGQNSDGSDGNTLGDYYANPPPQPKSIGAERASTKESFQTNTLGMQSVPAPREINENLELNNFQSNYLDNINANEYYKKFIPNYTPAAIPPKMVNGYPYPSPTNPYYAANNNIGTTNAALPLQSGNSDVLIQKLNYMINLLEEKQDERTNNVTEEVILYSFLGIFIIFIVDSFTRVGRYTR